jgi:hypothetical protein
VVGVIYLMDKSASMMLLPASAGAGGEPPQRQSG